MITTTTINELTKSFIDNKFDDDVIMGFLRPILIINNKLENWYDVSKHKLILDAKVEVIEVTEIYDMINAAMDFINNEIFKSVNPNKLLKSFTILLENSIKTNKAPSMATMFKFVKTMLVG